MSWENFHRDSATKKSYASRFLRISSIFLPSQDFAIMLQGQTARPAAFPVHWTLAINYEKNSFQLLEIKFFSCIQVAPCKLDGIQCDDPQSKDSSKFFFQIIFKSLFWAPKRYLRYFSASWVPSSVVNQVLSVQKFLLHYHLERVSSGLTLSRLVSRFHLGKMQIFHLGKVFHAGWGFVVGVVLRFCHFSYFV